MTREKFMNDYWNYYLLLEDKFINAIRYVELSANNYDTHSIEFANQIQSLGSEVDAVFKGVCGFASSDRKTIADYAPVIIGKYPSITSQNVKVEGKEMTITPFGGWNVSCPSQSLFWWEKYNNVKHGRVANFADANLKCVLYLLGGLFTLEMHWIKDIADNADKGIDIPDRESRLFQLLDWQTRYEDFTKLFCEINYDAT